ncbi:hypothetical protein [Nocardia sp. NBC_01009]|uniref:hypothetical protein n=1 Tax=Nocardia sp. NBC_01009 TaxID=2975996 RepID=UPI003865AA42|nr:hypothetical protein OHA42_33980 [Nocardia sp. NBC_01009]
MELLSPEVTLWTDGGGKVRQVMRPVVGAPTVAALFGNLGRHPYQGIEFADMTVELVEINGSRGLLFSGRGRVIATVTFAFDRDSRIVTIHNVANPDKLHAVGEGITHDISAREYPEGRQG